MKLFLVLVGASKHDAALLMPCGSYQFLWCPEVDMHVLDGGPLTMERFNEASEDLARRWQHDNSRFRWAPRIDDYAETPHENALADQLAQAEAHAGAMAKDADAQIEELRRQLASKEALIVELSRRPARKLVPVHPAADVPQPPTE